MNSVLSAGNWKTKYVPLKPIGARLKHMWGASGFCDSRRHQKGKENNAHKQNVWQLCIYYSQWHWAAFCCTSIKLLELHSAPLRCYGTSPLPRSAPPLGADSGAAAGAHCEEITSCLITLIGKVTWQSWFPRQITGEEHCFSFSVVFHLRAVDDTNK